MESATTPRKSYTVQVLDVPEHERLIFRLIFSVSFKSRGRDHAYVMHSEQDHGVPDIVISGAFQSLPSKSDATLYVAVVDGDEIPGVVCIQRPLIATRVLGVLDRLVTDAAAAVAIDAAEAHRVSTAERTLAPTSQLATVAGGDGSRVQFVISEEEASELAIVHDEDLANPANSGDSPVPLSGSETVPAPLASAPSTAAASDVSPAASSFDDAIITDESAVARAPVSAPAVASAGMARRKRRARVVRSLVVDDSASVRKQLELELNFFSTEVDYAGTAAEAMRLLEEHYYDVAFLDVVLPDTNGFQICKRIKATSRSTSVIMLTGKSTQADRVKGALAGCDAYLVKPVGRSTFQGTVKNYLEPAPSALVAGT